jgi:hypothetical protein
VGELEGVPSSLHWEEIRSVEDWSYEKLAMGTLFRLIGCIPDWVGEVKTLVARVLSSSMVLEDSVSNPEGTMSTCVPSGGSSNASL